MDSTTTIDPSPARAEEESRARRSARAPRRGWRRLLSGLGLVAAVMGGGATYELIASRSDAATYPMPGRLVDVGGHRLHLDCEGTGTPAIVLDAGLGGASPVWQLVQSRLAQSTTVCSFDRAGMGWSEAGPLPRTPQRNAEELYQLLANAGVEGSYILVGHSLAGKNARLFAAAHPADVAGMVLVDARSERLDLAASQEEVDGFRTSLAGQAALYTIVRRLGLVRLLGASLAASPLVSPQAALQMALLETSPNAIATTGDEGNERAHDDALLAVSSLGDLPLVVIAAADSMSTIAGWPAAQNGLASLSSNGRLVIAEHSGHAVQLDEPEVVVAAVLSVLADARESASMP